jgi:hypothetical protein
MRPRRRAKTVRGGTAFPPVALRLRLRTGLDPPCGPAAPRSALRRTAPPAGYPEKSLNPLRSGEENGLPGLSGGPRRGDQGYGRVPAVLAPLRGLRGFLGGCCFRARPRVDL